ncbi:hypothetical protein [Riemerella columbipharyngis]|uniref:DUF4157 domain-containing protein n=1 Tax=Riemerella columbipharyngis TaxID=1071918 RepID=A0A1G7BTA0_9FLAO|nr:hypothetical protein [Riemerella columbipharyngis]SDE30361.1 hypothetical protein SAMN05421544_106118 [Riemerella columbipharyngis]
MILIKTKWLKNTKVQGIALYPFIILRRYEDKTNFVLINHEKIHLRQQLELLIIFFYIWYILEFLIRWTKYQNYDKAYRKISFEQEAYAHDQESNYLEKRKFWSFVKYLK